ncbi:MAG: leucine-rich repeat protein [Kiritimatiellae bacterium]|nr:leucine-rich repeat protein [Kiritimatiellia bacterium]
MKRLPLLFAFCALALPASATWTYTADAGKVNNCPYSDIISDGNWQIRVYQPDAASDDFWLGCGGAGTGARVAGSGVLDLSTLLADTTADGTPVRAVNVAPYFLKEAQGNLEELVLPNTVTNVGNVAFELCNANEFTSLDLRNTQIRSIQPFAFAWDQKLAEVWLPETLEYIGKCALRTMPSKVTIHFAGDVPFLQPPSGNSYGSSYNAYVSQTEYQNVYQGGTGNQWAFCVNAEKYPNWTRIAKAAYYDAENPFPSGEADWVPAPARSIAGYSAPFGNTWFSRTSDTSANGRSYLVQEGTWSGAPVAKPFFGAPVVDAKRTAITNTIPLWVGSSAPVTVTYTFNGDTTTLTATADTNLVFGVDGLSDSTTFSWSVSATGSAGWDRLEGTATTLTPDVVLGEPFYEITKDGKCATVSIPVTSLLSASALLEFVLDNRIVFTTNATATGVYSYTDSNLILGKTYDFTIYGSAGADEDMKTFSFVAERYKWTYTPGSGTKNGYPYTGTISDKNWTIYVYQPDPGSDAFWLGCGGSGTSSRVTGSGVLDLTPVLDDTAEDGTPVRIVRVARYAFQNQTVDSLILPNTCTNIGQMAFENSGVQDVDLSQSIVKSIEAFAFAWTGVTNVTLPKTLNFIGGFAFRNCGEKAVLHFAGRPPELELLTENVGSQFGHYIQFGTYENIWRSGDNKQCALCVDYKMFPEWAELGAPWTTTYYLPVEIGADFPSREASWIPEAVRYTVNPAYKAPFGTTNYGRSYDTSANGRSYLIYEKHGDACTMMLIR